MHTCTPETVKYGISNFTWMGGFLAAWSSVEATDGSENLARSRYSLPPGICFIFHTNAELSGA